MTPPLQSLQTHPRRLFLLDGAGALVSALALGVVLPLFAPELGVSASTLRALATIAVGYALVDLGWVVARPMRPSVIRAGLLGVAGLNAAYPLVTVVALVRDGQDLSGLGMVYFGVEFVVVWGLAWVEVRVARALGD